MNETTFRELLGEKKIYLNSEQLNKFALYYNLLLDWNKAINLTAITKKEEVYEKHFFDSLTTASSFSFSNQLLCDVGSGAGFPSIPLKICFPQLKITVVDSLKKRCLFLDEVVKSLCLNDVRVVHSRVESFGKSPDNREKFDVVTARAVAKLVVLAELCLPLVKVGGFFLSMKGATGDTEIREAHKAIHKLGGKLGDKEYTLLPIEKSKRQIIHIQKIKTTPQMFPRKEGIPQKKPLI